PNVPAGVGDPVSEAHLLIVNQKYDAAIAILEKQLTKNNIKPSLLGPLATALKELGKAAEAERVINILATSDYADPEESDYRNYVLAYYQLWHKDAARAMEHLRRIKSAALLAYAGSS